MAEYLANDTKSLEKDFCSRRIKLIDAFKHNDNPFSDPPEEFINIVLKALTSAKASCSVKSALQIGQSPCNLLKRKNEANIIVRSYT